MLAVIFEFRTDEGHRAEYLELAAGLRAELEHMDGFISIERFQSLSDPERVVSISYWRDEAALVTWRNLARHRAAQSRGRAGLFSEYRLRVAEVVRDYTHSDREQAPADSVAVHG